MDPNTMDGPSMETESPDGTSVPAAAQEPAIPPATAPMNEDDWWDWLLLH